MPDSPDLSEIAAPPAKQLAAPQRRDRGFFDRFNDEDPETGGPRMGFLDHLMELRKRLWKALVVTLLCMVAALIFSKELFDLMRAPADDVNRHYAAQFEHDHGKLAPKPPP